MSAPVAIAIVSWNTADLLDACLRSMRADADEGLAEVWVVDNGSTDGSVELVRKRHPWARLLVPGRNLGYGPAVNLVARSTSSRWVAPSNSDVELEPGALRALVDAGERDPRIGVLGPRLILSDGSTQPGVQPFPGVWTALLQTLPAHRLSRRAGERLSLPQYWEPDRAADVDWLTGAFLLVRREAWDQIGGFDDDQWMYAEDIDLCWRLHRAGWQARYEPAARVHHALSVAAEKAFGDADRRATKMLRADYQWLQRRRGTVVASTVAALHLAGLGARVALLRALSATDTPRWHEKAGVSVQLLRRHRAAARGLFAGSR